MERITELYGKLGTLTGEELDELRGLLEDEYKRLDEEPTTADNVSAINALVEQMEGVMAEGAAREQAQAEAEAAKEAARERVKQMKGESTEDGGGDGEDAGDGEDGDEDAPAEEEPEAAEVAEEVAVTASGGVRRMARGAARPKPSPEAGGDNPNRAVLTASAALGHLSGKELDDRMELAAAIATKLERMNRNGEDVLVASAAWQYPEDRRLVNDEYRNAEIMERVAGLHAPRVDKETLALVASGGICLPGNVDYDVGTWASADRPVARGLVSFGASRGALRFVQPPDIIGGVGLAGATGIWTEATDASPGSATKPVIAVACGAVSEVFVEAITTRVQFGNMQGRFAPEQVAANTDLAIAAAARIAENNLLSLIQAQCVAGVVTNTPALGATRDMLATIYLFVANFRQIHRLSDSVTLTAIFPEWLRAVMKVDLLREIGHDNAGERDVLKITDAQIDDLIKAAGVNPIWHMDGQAAASGFGSQNFVQQASGAIQPFPNLSSNVNVLWYIFIEGTMQFLDGGRLDLGVVRDSVLDSTNDYETFVETFEGLAYRGFANGAYALSTSLKPNGGTGGTVSVSNTDN